MRRLILLLIVVMTCLAISGCTQDTPSQDTSSVSVSGESSTANTPDETADADNGIHIFVQSEVRDVTLNGISVPVTEDTFIPVQGGEAIVVTYSYPWGDGMQEATVTLDSYYRYFVIKNNGRYASAAYEETYLADQISD